ncbi:basic proline-rich protein-like [Heterocephalus glaber]|uniref:Basic proline-rich protein-like n=1 Tax=Heterocephalus glaber TaxID=10181 RepID=A0AAX6S5D7_HETGA|nr:basic proline-rich protein-like [Heterocephalus glaber]
MATQGDPASEASAAVRLEGAARHRAAVDRRQTEGRAPTCGASDRCWGHEEWAATSHVPSRVLPPAAATQVQLGPWEGQGEGRGAQGEKDGVRAQPARWPCAARQSPGAAFQGRRAAYQIRATLWTPRPDSGRAPGVPGSPTPPGPKFEPGRGSSMEKARRGRWAPACLPRLGRICPRYSPGGKERGKSAPPASPLSPDPVTERCPRAGAVPPGSRPAQPPRQPRPARRRPGPRASGPSPGLGSGAGIAEAAAATGSPEDVGRRTPARR